MILGGMVLHASATKRLHVLQLGLDRIELPETAKQPVSRKRTKSEADSPASSAQNAPSPGAGPPGAPVRPLSLFWQHSAQDIAAGITRSCFAGSAELQAGHPTGSQPWGVLCPHRLRSSCMHVRRAVR